MITLGVILMVLGFLIGIPVLWSIGILLVLVGAIAALIGMSGRQIAGRSHWY